MLLTGCSGTFSHYEKVERSLQNGEPAKAVELIEAAEDDYGADNHLLYLMDQGMVLHLAGRYQESNTILEEADKLIEEQYTIRFRNQFSALLLNETQLPYKGEPFEQVLINVIKALNYALLQNWTESLVEARKIDHRLNVFSDRAQGDEYQEDPFARYLTGILYEIAEDWNNAYVAYRKAEAVYEDTQAWSGVSIPDTLKTDLIRATAALHLEEDGEHFRMKYPEVDSVSPMGDDANMAQLIVVTYNGRGPKKEDRYIDVPVSLDALKLVFLAKGVGGSSTRATRGRDTLLYGIHGRVARIAVPQLIPQRSQVAYSLIELASETRTLTTHSQRIYDIGAVAEKNLDDVYHQLVVRAVARAAMKMAAAEGIGAGARSKFKGDSRNILVPLVTILVRLFAIGTEEADIRSWRTLPGEIQLARLWIPSGSYNFTINAVDHQGRTIGSGESRQLDIQKGEVRFLLQHHLEIRE